eukprot:CAMPEP_0203831812 /NCGR_PEP_ID=MMETSP0115-20131106/69183_1 /ASSEMBLY_ACC=CAM_ASM_000227 /TAXON_ID=33651 /ORGANISM="Bicosoecid sp, Strain ms1" /LENGTH=62 /DNA_ID=CAMNT_0050740869 /DNA_START=151 /DNA_END=336 /DNA_ORIENTATION=+
MSHSCSFDSSRLLLLASASTNLDRHAPSVSVQGSRVAASASASMPCLFLHLIFASANHSESH